MAQTGNLQIFGAAAQDVFAGMGPDSINGPALNFGYAGSSFGRGAGFFNVRPDALATAPNPSLRFATGNLERMIITNTGRVGIGTTGPSSRLDVAGNINTSTQYNIGGSRVLGGEGTDSVCVGVNAGVNNTGERNSFFGRGAGFGQAGNVNNGSYNSFFGTDAGQANDSGQNNAFFGAGAGYLNTNGNSNSYFGESAGFENRNGEFNSFFGSSAGRYTSGSSNSFFGEGVGRLTTGDYNVFFGRNAGETSQGGSRNTFIGTFANFNLSLPTGDNDTLLGYLAKVNTGVNNPTAIGAYSQVTQSNSLVLGSIDGVNTATANSNVGIGTTEPATRLHIVGSFNAGATPANHVALIENTSTGNNADGLAIKIGQTGFPTSSNNFITFFKGDDTSAGSIQGNGFGAVELGGTGSDYAEWLPRLNPAEHIQPGHIVGLYAGHITKDTRSASQ
ncbi:MAG: hypothetical protein DMF60_01630, partial [Acidobacteria bacterium]